jgi:hypothetical protein
MSDSEKHSYRDEETDSALLEAELFLKYQVPHRAIERLRIAIEQKPQSILLRERLREIAGANNGSDEAARQCLALANLYITHDDFDCAQERLLEAKQLDARISVTSGLEAIRRARRNARTYRTEQQRTENARVEADWLSQSELSATPAPVPPLAGDLAAVSIFDAVQVIENSRLTGMLIITSLDAAGGKDSLTARGKRRQHVLFNEGQIVGAEIADASGTDAFRRIIETTEGTFKFEKSALAYPVTIQASSNTNLLLDSLRQFDEEKM